MATKEEIHAFAICWLEKYRNQDTTEREIFEGFDEACFALGFVMDCGQSFEAQFPETKAFQDAAALDEVVNQIQDLHLLGSAIFSKWRYVTYWAQASLLERTVRDWFIIAFSRLVVLSTDDGLRSLLFQGQAAKIKIVVNSIGEIPCLLPDTEVEQRLTVCADGRVWFSGYNFGQDRAARRKTSTIGIVAAGRILKAVGSYFSTEYIEIDATDVGRWQLTITNTDGNAYRFNGPLCCDFVVDRVDLSELIRDTLAMPDLLVFDGNCKPDRVDKITIDYHRVTKNKDSFTNSDSQENAAWDCFEQLVIDRKTETLELTRRIGAGCVVSHKYCVQEGVSDLLDELDSDDLFEEIAGNGPDVVVNPNQTKDYTITVAFDKRPPVVICGTYDKNGLPEDWPELAARLRDFIDDYGLGEILAPSVYLKVRRKVGDYIVCSVKFDEGSKSYYYRTDDDTLSIGDSVFVPVGKDGHLAIVEIVKIDYFPQEKLPFPLQKMKQIIRKCTVAN